VTPLLTTKPAFRFVPVMVNKSGPGPTMLTLLLMTKPPEEMLVMKPVTANVMTSPLRAVGNNVRNVPGPVFA